MSTVTARPQGRVKLTAAEFTQMLDAGLFEGRHVQLLDGELYEVTKNSPHNFAVFALGQALRTLLPSTQYLVWEEKSIEPSEFWWPEPDIAITRGPARQFAGHRAASDELLLVVEVSDSSEQDWTKKLPGYAAAGIPVYWIVDLAQRRVEIHREPGPSGYGVQEIISEKEHVTLTIDGRSFGTIAVSEFLP
jgi:Uma2 family endonuclease